MMQLVFGLKMNEQDASSQCSLHKTTARDTVWVGMQFTFVAFENFSTFFSQSDFTSYSMGGTADFTVDRQRSLFFPAMILQFSGTLKFIWTREGKKWNLEAIVQISMF